MRALIDFDTPVTDDQHLLRLQMYGLGMGPLEPEKTVRHEDVCKHPNKNACPKCLTEGQHLLDDAKERRLQW